jgi:hypothetical protein
VHRSLPMTKRDMRPTLLAALLALTGVACRPTVQLTPQGRQVQLISTPPSDLLASYTDLGVVSCSRGAGFIPQRKSEANIVECQHELRNKAAAMNADLVVMTSQQLGAGDCGSCVTLVGTAYRRKGV